MMMSAPMPGRSAQEVIWTPHPGFQTRAIACGADEVLLGGRAAGGKTDVLIALAAMYASSHPQAKVIFCRTVAKDLLEVLDRMHARLTRVGFAWRDSEKRWHHRDGGTILMAHAETYKEAASSFLGTEYTHALWDEIGLLGDVKVWSELRTRLRSPAMEIRPQMRCTANPGGPGHAWLKARFVTPCGKGGERTYRDEKTGDVIAYIPGSLEENLSIDREAYRRKLRGSTELRRRQLEDGDWDAGEGLSFDLSRTAHVAPVAFRVPDHWTVFGAHDWGYAHYWAFGLFAADEDGTVWLVDSTSGTGDQPDAIVDRVKRCVERQGWGLDRLSLTVAGHDVWNKRVAVGGNTPSLVEQYQTMGWYMSRANVARVLGANNIRLYLQYRTFDGRPRAPRLRMMPTAHNERIWTCLETRVADPGDTEDVLKPKEGQDDEGLDDVYDMVRYGLASRPLAAERLLAPNQRDGFRTGLDPKTGKPNPRERAMDAFEKKVLGMDTGMGFRTPGVGRIPGRGAA